MYKLNTTHYSIASSAVESKSIVECETINEVADIIQMRADIYFDRSHPVYAMHTPTPKEIVHYGYGGDRMGNLVQLNNLTDYILNHKNLIKDGNPFRIIVQYYDHLNERYTPLITFSVKYE